MIDPDFESDLRRLGEALRAGATDDLSDEESRRPSAPRVQRARSRPRLVASGALALLGAGVAMVLFLAGSPATPPAFAVTRRSDGSVLVRFNFAGPQTLLDVDDMLRREYRETIEVTEARGAATTRGPLKCRPTPAPGRALRTPVRVLLGSDGTGEIPPGFPNSGTVHLTSCSLGND